jgi:hypothetical protein
MTEILAPEPGGQASRTGQQADRVLQDELPQALPSGRAERVGGTLDV